MNLEPYWSLIQRTYPQFSNYDLAAIQFVTQGWDSLVLDINNEYIFRFPRRETTRQQFLKEIGLLPELKKTLSYPIPNFEFIHLAQQELAQSFIGYRKLPGISLDQGTARSQHIIAQLGTFLAELHHFPVEEAVRLQIPFASPQDWRQNYLDFYRWVRTYCFPEMQAIEISHFSAVWEDFLGDEHNFAFQTVLIHGDLVNEHILYDPNRVSLSGIIDWGDARIGDPALDFVGLYITGGENLVRHVMKIYQEVSTDDFWQRIKFYSAIIPFYEYQHGFKTQQEHFIQHGLHIIKESTLKNNR